MQFVIINDSLAPIRLLRLAGSLLRGQISDAELAKLLVAEREFMLRQVALDERWIDVLDLSHFQGVTAVQRQMIAQWLVVNVALIAEVNLGIAVVVPPELGLQVDLLTDPLERLGLPNCVCDDLDAGLYWALELAYDEDVIMDPTLVIAGVQAFRARLD